MANIWKEPPLYISRERKNLFESTGKAHLRQKGNRNQIFHTREREKGLWSTNTPRIYSGNSRTTFNRNVLSQETSRPSDLNPETTPELLGLVKSVSNEIKLVPVEESGYTKQGSSAPNGYLSPVGDNSYYEEPPPHTKVPGPSTLMVESVEERGFSIVLKDDVKYSPSYEEGVDTLAVSDTLESLNEEESNTDGNVSDLTSSPAGNPFHIFRVKQARSTVDVTNSQLSRLKNTILSRTHKFPTLLSWFRSSISVTNAAMMHTILTFLCDIIKSDVSFRADCVRMMEVALVYHADDLVQAFSVEHIIPLFQPEDNDDVGGSFIRLILSYKATFEAPGIDGIGVPICLNSNGEFVYNARSGKLDGNSYEDNRSKKVATYSSLDASTLHNDLDSSKGATENRIPPDRASNITACGKIESMTILKICADRAGVSSAFDIPASRLRDWLCTIWYELPGTRPPHSLIKLCINWIDSKDDPSCSNDAAFAILQAERDAKGEFEGGKLLMLELFSHILQKQGDVSVDLSKIVDMLAEGEENTLYAVLGSIIAYNFKEKDMLDFWCLLCILPWPLNSPNSAICRLMSCTFLVYYKIIHESIDNRNDLTFDSNPMAILETVMRICACRAISPILAKRALLQTILLVELSPLPAIKMSTAPLILSSLCPFFWKCHFIWSNIGGDIDHDNILALRHLYDLLSACVFCTPLADKVSEMVARNVPMFPRVRFSTESQPVDDVYNFIPRYIGPETSGNPSEEATGKSKPECDIKPDKKLDSPRGLKNLGNSCYYNSILQALFHTRLFVHSLLGMKENNETVGTYKKLFVKMLKRGKKALDPGISYKLLPSKWRQTSEQQDVTEVFHYVMESIDRTMGLWKRVFMGMILRRIKCMHCKTLSDNSEVAADFNFPISNLNSIQEIFDDYCKIEPLRGENRYFCSKCNKYRDADMWNVIASPPSHLIVILNRQVWITDSMEGSQKTGANKQLRHVKIDEKLRICQFDYRLYGCILHSGESTTSGHYYFIGRDSELQSNWHMCDDSQVRPVTSSTINDISEDSSNSQVPYVIFYRCEQAPATPQ
ncbi:ubiquitin carboxyl-terminal hydrolase domain containing protein [Babesia gibsoni]|uniref:Ubiquitin carboxyl-terminal hydrolase domain containing protein n=1 Tax=Babesia gibsoni TaxID=33632 RepID=A0AAD8PFM6_BABGI|nr:ubiquitin carboxyl-terminal hydrolase domain containing protein [Babesia gibsoni]